MTKTDWNEDLGKAILICDYLKIAGYGGELFDDSDGVCPLALVMVGVFATGEVDAVEALELAVSVSNGDADLSALLDLIYMD